MQLVPMTPQRRVSAQSRNSRRGFRAIHLAVEQNGNTLDR
jgi:hypothetical protein